MASFQRRRRVKRAPTGPDGRVVPFTPFLGMILIVSSFFLYAASGLIAPWWGVVLMITLWLVLFVLCCVWWSKHPRRLVWIGALSYPLWFCLVVSGALVFGWEAGGPFGQ